MKKRSFSAQVVLIFYYLIKIISCQDGEVERRFACWGSVGPPVVSAQCPRDMVLHVVRAGLKVQNTAGSKCAYSEDDCGCSTDTLGCQLPDVDDLCTGKTACRLDVTQQYIDTGICQGFSDYMFIEYHCVKVDESSQDVCVTGSSQQASGFLTSPNYPHTYPHNRHCECTLTTGPNAAIELHLLDLQLADRDCNNDGLEVQYSGQMLRLCGDSNGQRDRIETDSQSVKLVFDTDQEDGDNGFWIKYRANPPQDIVVDCVSTYKPENFVQLGNSPTLLHEETDYKEIYTVDTPIANDVEQPQGYGFLDTDQVAPENILTGTVAYVDSPNTINENKKNFENVLFNENQSEDGEVAKNSPGGMSRFAKEGRQEPDDTIKEKLDKKIRQALVDGDVSTGVHDAIIGNVIQYRDEINGIDVIEIEPPIPLQDTEVMKGDMGLNISEDINTSNDKNKNLLGISNRHEKIEDESGDLNNRNGYDSDTPKTENEESGGQEEMLQDRRVGLGKTEVYETETDVMKATEYRPNAAVRVSNDNTLDKKEYQNHQQQDKEKILDNSNIETDTTEKVFTTMTQPEEGVNTIKSQRSNSYDRISFERDLFEEYSDIDSSETQGPEPRQNTLQRNINTRPRQRVRQRERPKQTERVDNPSRHQMPERIPIQRPEKLQRVNFQRSNNLEQRMQTQRPERISRVQRLEIPRRTPIPRPQKPEPVQIPKKEKPARPRYRQARYRIGQRLGVSREYDEQKFQNFRESQRTRSHSQLNEEPKVSQRLPKERDNNIDNKPRTSAPWWWQYTAKTQNSIQEQHQPIEAPTPIAVLNDAMKNKFTNNNYQNVNLRKGNVPIQDDTISGEVPLQRNADNFIVDNGESIQTGLLEGQKHDSEETEPKRNSMKVTVIAVGAISVVVLIVVTAIVVKWMLNKRARKRAMRHRHQKECMMRQQHLRQSSGMPRNLR